MATRSRVRSFISQFSSSGNREQTTSPTPARSKAGIMPQESPRPDPSPTSASVAPHHQSPNAQAMSNDSPAPQRESAVSTSRPVSMLQSYQPPLMDVSQDTIPELLPIFTFLNSHGNKLYQEGYFLKLDDQNTQGKPNPDRTWTECFAQLVGTVLSLWDAAELDAAGQDGEVLPKFINLTDASIKMIESLPTRSNNEAPLQNVLSISTAGKNRYLLHFNSHHSLIQWTAGIRLAMFEHSTLQEAYTGALIAGKGKTLNNINVILERARMPTADWARVRFGAGTPWRRCWCVITPPDEKEVQKLQKQLSKKKSAYDRSAPPVLKGDIKFYESKKTKKTRPIATISDAYSAYAIYPQSKPLIDASTLVKVEGSITIHSNPPSITEGFVFVMPEAHPAVTGFEILLRWLFPAFDTFALYGRPTRLIAETKDPRSLMFAMPKQRRYGYLEIIDVSSLILEQGSGTWRESEWRKRMKELTGKRMTAIENGTRRDSSRYGGRNSARNSFGPSRNRIQFDDGASIRSSPSITWNNPPQTDGSSNGIPRTDSAPSGTTGFVASRNQGNLQHQHHRSVSETHGLDRYQNQNPALHDSKFDHGPPPPPHARTSQTKEHRYYNEMAATPERVDSEDEQTDRNTPVRELQELQSVSAPEPVAAPPAFSHAPGEMPITKPQGSPELRRANSRMSSATLSQLAGASGVVATYQTTEDLRHQDGGRTSEDRSQRGVMSSDAKIMELPLTTPPHEGLATSENHHIPLERSSHSHPTSHDSPTQHSQSSLNFPFSTSSSKLDSKSADVVGDDDIFSNSTTHAHPVQRLQSHSSHLSNDSTQSTSTQPYRQSRQSILRKPLAAQSPGANEPNPGLNISSGINPGHPVMDQAVYNMIRLSTQGGTTAHGNPQRQNSGISSNYDRDDDNDSTASPDYASTRKSVDTRRSMDKPRAGVMRTVGRDENDPLSQRPISSVPDFDFGPTPNYGAPQKQFPVQNHGRHSPGPGMSNIIADRKEHQHSPVRRPESGGHSRPQSPYGITPENFHVRNDSTGSRTLAWQPGIASGSISPGPRASITAEQFVQQRAAASTPQFTHHRQTSSGNLMRGATPPLVRNRSSELLTYHSRNNSTDMLQRPNSRGANAALGSGDISSKLSAREQEQVARVTGQPLISVAQNRRDSQGAGLVGAIQQREHEKQQMKQGINSQAVQQAINQRQQQQVPMYRKASPAALPSQIQYGVNNMSQYQSRGQPNPQQQQSWVSPANVYWAASPTSAIPHDMGRQSPSQYPPRQQYPFPAQQGQPGYQNRSNPAFHGHGS